MVKNGRNFFRTNSFQMSFKWFSGVKYINSDSFQWFLSVSEVQKWAIYKVGGWKMVKKWPEFFWFNTIMTFKWFLGLKDIISDSFNDFRVWARYNSEQCKKSDSTLYAYHFVAFSKSSQDIFLWALIWVWVRYKNEQCWKNGRGTKLSNAKKWSNPTWDFMHIISEHFSNLPMIL